MKKHYFFFCCLVLPFLGWGQGFEAIFGTQSSDFGQKVFEVPNDDAYLVFYYLIPGNVGDSTGLGIAKFDTSGNLLWQKFDDGAYSLWNISDFVVEADGFRFIYPRVHGVDLKSKKFDFEGNLVQNVNINVPASNFLPMARFFPDNTAILNIFNTGNNILELYKIGQNGNVLWTRTFPSNQFISTSCADMITMDDNSFLTITRMPNNYDTIIISKLDASGNSVWQRPLAQQIYSKVFIMPYPDGDSYFVWGDNPLSVGGTFIARIGMFGQVFWHKDFTPFCDDIGQYGVVHGEGNTLYLTGLSNNGKIKLLQLGEGGNVLWEKTYGDAFGYNAGRLTRTQDGGLFVSAGVYLGQNSPLDPFVIKTDANGEVNWSWQKDHTSIYAHYDAIQTLDGEYLVLGTSEDAQDFQNYLIKFTSYGSVYDNLIQGRLFHDTDLSCSQSNGETKLANWTVKATGSQTTYATTFPDGSFWLPTNNDSALVNAIPPNDLWATCPDPATVLFDAAPYDTTSLELFSQAIKNCPLLEVDVSTPFLRRCFTNTYSIQCKNTGTIAAENTKIKVYIDPLFEFIDASATLVSQNEPEYIFDVGTLGIGETYTMTVRVGVSCDAELGQTHCLSVRAVADNTCPDIDNALANSRECQPNTGSFDPNDKRAFSEGNLVERFIAADSLIEYQIRFQNTGTDTAFTVVIADTLSNLLDIESIRNGASSHTYRMELAQNNIVKFVFEDIMLPDSNVNEPASHGFVKFSIRHRPGLVPGDVIPNKAAIYFDFNEAVITNNLELEIESPVSRTHEHLPADQQLLVYPQPAHDVVVFERLGEPGHLPCRLQIMNLLGQVIYDQAMVGAVQRVQGLPAGQHFYRLRQNGEVVAVGKVMVVGLK